jgi:hypothetical protein
MKQSDSILIRVGKDLWKILNQKKEAGDTFDDVLRKALGLENKEDE